MFFKTKPDPLAAVRAAIETKDFDQMSAAIDAVVAEFGLSSEVSHKLMSLIEEKRLVFVDLLQRYINANPKFVTTAQLHLAEIYLHGGEDEMASSEARLVLKRLLTSPAFRTGAIEAGRKAMAARAYLLTTAIYTSVGARSYSLRLLERARPLARPEGVVVLEEERARLNRELLDPEKAELDQKWEAFFSRFDYADELITHCQSLGRELFARRVDLLRDHFRFNSSYRITSDEVLLDVYQTDAKDTGTVCYLLQ